MDFLVLGVKGLAVGFVYALPIIVVSVGAAIFSAVVSDSEGLVTLFSICFGCLTFIYSIFLALVIPAAMGILADTDDIVAAINPSKILELVRAEPASFIIAIVGVFLVNFLSSFGVILCVVGLLFTYAYSLAVTGHLYGQAYNQATAGSMKAVEV
jgi:hypothetical protein